MIATSQLFTFFKVLVLHLCIEHVVWRFGIDARKKVGPASVCKTPYINPYTKTLNFAWAPPTPMKLLPCSLKEYKVERRET